MYEPGYDVATPQQPSGGGAMMGGAEKGASVGGPWGALIGAGAGLLSYHFLQKPAYERQLKLAAISQMMAPFTHMAPMAPPAQVNPMAAMMATGTAGAQLGQNMDQSKSRDQLNKAYIDYLNAARPNGNPRGDNTNPWGGNVPAPAGPDAGARPMVSPNPDGQYLNYQGMSPQASQAPSSGYGMLPPGYDQNPWMAGGQ